jgi:hypothetical protein
VCANTVVSEDFKLYEKGSSLDPFPKKSIWGSALANIIYLVHVSLLAQGANKRLHTAVENAVAYVNKLVHLGCVHFAKSSSKVTVASFVVIW